VATVVEEALAYCDDFWPSCPSLIVKFGYS
jgi:hypothetical protein